MPEVAEVALMALAIRNLALMSKITNIEILAGRYTKRPLEGLENLISCLPLNVLAVKTKGKRCWLELEADFYILISFGMSGTIYYEPEQSEILNSGLNRAEYMKYYHIKVSLLTPDDQAEYFYFSDVRQFGSWRIFRGRQALDQLLATLGPDVLSDEPLDQITLIARFRQRNKLNICKALMDQKTISGVGNYICSEALYQSRISPYAQIMNLSDQVIVDLYHNIRQIARNAFEAQGASLLTYRGVDKQKGDFQNFFKVYRQQFDPEGRPIVVIPDRESPDRRTKHYVPEIQTLGLNKISPPKVKLKIPLSINPNEDHHSP